MSDTSVDVLIFSDDKTTRQAIINAVGARASKNSPRIEWHEAATHFGVTELVKNTAMALLILDGEATKEGGMSIAKELDTTFEDLPPIIVLTARPQDDWLATWAGAKATIAAPFDPIEVQETVARLLAGGR